MELDLSIFTFFSLALFVAFLLLLSSLIFMLRIVTGKSITNSEYPPVNGIVYGQLFYMSKIYDHQTEIAKKQGTFQLLAAAHSEIYTTDPRNIEHILKTKFEDYGIGKHNQEIFRDTLGEGIFAVDGDEWRQQRKLSSHEFAMKVHKNYSNSVFRSNAANLVQTISEFSRVGQVFDIQALLMRCSLDNIFKVAFGVDLNDLEDLSSRFMKAIDDTSVLIAWRFIDPFWKLKRFLNVSSEASIKNNIKLVDYVLEGVIKSKRKILLHQQKDNVDKEDILTRFLIESEKDPMKMNDKYLRDIIFNFMIAGKDTTAGTISWFFYMLCKNPIIQEKVVEEVRNSVGLEEDEEVDVNVFMEKLIDSALEKMHYLHAALTETLRLYPSVPMNGRIAETDDILPDGYRVKKGDVVLYMAYAMGRMSYLWGEDAEDFKPERWLKNGTFLPQSPFKFITFHAGPRICLGKEFAYRQMKIIAATLLQFFRFKLADDTKNLTYSIMVTLHIDGGLPLVALPRRKIT